MILHRTIPAKRLLALLASVCMATAMGACSPNGDSQSQQQPSSQSSATADAGNVAIFAPTDSITISQQTPLSKWEKLVPEIVSSLKRTGVKSGDITVKTASNLDKQSQSVQDYVVNHINGTEHSSTKAKNHLRWWRLSPRCRNPTGNTATMHGMISRGTPTRRMRTNRIMRNQRNGWFRRCSLRRMKE